MYNYSEGFMTMSTTRTPNERYWLSRIERAAKALEANCFGASVHETAQDAAAYLVNDILGADWRGTINFGGSASVLQSGVVLLLQALPGANVLPNWDPALSREETLRLRREHFMCELYLASCNAVTMDGQLCNLDKIGNRIASLVYGPDAVALFVGRNKLCETLEVARDRVRTVAAPMNNIRLGLSNPCVKTGRCMDCNLPTRICNMWSVHEKSFPAGRIHVLLVNQDLGF